MMVSLTQLFQQGGWVLVAIAALSVWAWWLLFRRFFESFEQLGWSQTWAERCLDQLRAGDREALAACESRPSLCARMMLLSASQAGTDLSFEQGTEPLLQAESQRLHDSLSLIAVVAAALPLMGLLGTVLGMVTTFSAITQHGSSDPALLADGVSQALITTQAGLVTSLPLLLGHRLLAGRMQRLIDSSRLYARRARTVLEAQREVLCSKA